MHWSTHPPQSTHKIFCEGGGQCYKIKDFLIFSNFYAVHGVTSKQLESKILETICTIERILVYYGLKILLRSVNSKITSKLKN